MFVFLTIQGLNQVLPFPFRQWHWSSFSVALHLHMTFVWIFLPSGMIRSPFLHLKLHFFSLKPPFFTYLHCTSKSGFHANGEKSAQVAHLSKSLFHLSPDLTETHFESFDCPEAVFNFELGYFYVFRFLIS